MSLAYLDNNATTPLEPRALEAMLPWLEGRCGNPSSVHRAGRRARQAVDEARERVAALAGARPDEIVFTSGGTEASNLAIKGVAARREPGLMAVSAIEHPCVLEAADTLRARGWEIASLGVDPSGQVRGEAVDAVLSRQPALVSVMWANNETGVLQDVPALAARVTGDTLFHSDAVQAAGKVPLDFRAAGLHLMTLSAHKLRGPQGIGALLVRRDVPLDPLTHGGGQERGRRPGTENLAGIVGFGVAAELARTELDARAAHMGRLRDRLEAELAAIPGIRIVAGHAPRLPNTVLVLLPGMEGETLLMGLDRAGIAVSSGSACSSGKREPSHVLAAMGIPADEALSAVRISLGPQNTEADVTRVAAALGEQAGGLARMRGALLAG